MRRPELCRRADPRQSDDEKNLREDEVTKAELLVQDPAVQRDVMLTGDEIGFAARLALLHASATLNKLSAAVNATGDGCAI